MQNSQQIEDQAVAQGGEINTDELINQIKSQVKPEMIDLFEKVLISGGRIMFDAKSHEMALAEIKAEGPMEQKLSQGVIKLMILLWQKSNGTLPQDLMFPAAVSFNLMAYQYLVETQDPSANPQMLSESIDMTLQAVCEQLGTTMEEVMGAVQGGQSGQQAGAAPAQPQPKGLLQEEM